MLCRAASRPKSSSRAGVSSWERVRVWLRQAGGRFPGERGRAGRQAVELQLGGVEQLAQTVMQAFREAAALFLLSGQHGLDKLLLLDEAQVELVRFLRLFAGRDVEQHAA